MKKMSASRVEMTQLVLPEHTNALGTIFGGQIMAWIDIAAAIASFRHCRMSCVTASMDALSFLSPVRLGDIVVIRANVNFTSKTSLEVGVKVMSENPLTGEENHTSSAYLTFVALGADGKPTPVPTVVPETEKEKIWFAEGQERRAQRLRLRSKAS